MTLLHPLPDEAATLTLPRQFTYPFHYTPHPLCEMAAKEVIAHCYATPSMYPKEGKMFGVLVVQHKGKPHYLCAFSGIYNGTSLHEGFVPPVYNLQTPEGYFHQEEERICALSRQIAQCQDEQQALALKVLRKEKSNSLQMWAFRQFRLRNAMGEEKDLLDIFKGFKSPFTPEEYHNYKEGRTPRRPKAKVDIPPGGAGECCAPKLLQYAYLHQLRPLCMAEFWIGPSPKDELRVEGRYYPACQHKCRPILGHMLQGLDVEENPMLKRGRAMMDKVRILYEDDCIMVVSKPSGLLSVPGKNLDEPSLLTKLQTLCPTAMLPHRLDMDTSGIVLAANTLDAYKALQQQFLKHEVKKKYVALLDRPDYPASQPSIHGTISLPLSPNALDRPRQMVDHAHGKSAVTHYTFTDNDTVELIPDTGRTHQLRLHCAHPEGLGRPIKGDNLYGTPSTRLFLHARFIQFRHPCDNREMAFTEKAEWE